MAHRSTVGDLNSSCTVWLSSWRVQRKGAACCRSRLFTALLWRRMGSVRWAGESRRRGSI